MHFFLLACEQFNLKVLLCWHLLVACIGTPQFLLLLDDSIIHQLIPLPLMHLTHLSIFQCPPIFPMSVNKQFDVSEEELVYKISLYQCNQA